MAAVHDASETSTKGLNFILQRMENHGIISKDDIKVFFSDLRLPSMSDRELRKKMRDAGANDLGFVKLRDFFRFITGELEYAGIQDGLAAFKMFDKEHTGMMHADFFRKIMTKLGDTLSDAETDQIIRKADLDGEGVIYYEEFLQKTEEKNVYADNFNEKGRRRSIKRYRIKELKQLQKVKIQEPSDVKEMALEPPGASVSDAAKGSVPE